MRKAYYYVSLSPSPYCVSLRSPVYPQPRERCGWRPELPSSFTCKAPVPFLSASTVTGGRRALYSPPSAIKAQKRSARLQRLLNTIFIIM